MSTPFESKAEILSDFWLNYKDDVAFLDFVEFNDLGLPLAYALSNNIITKTEAAKQLIDDTFKNLLADLEVEKDSGFESLSELQEVAGF